MKKSWRYLLVILCLLGISLGSAVVGAKFGFELAREKFRQRIDPKAWNVQAMRSLEERLNLAKDQREKIKALMSAAVAKLQQTRQTTLKESGAVVDDLFAAVDAELNPRQQVLFRELIQDRPQVKREFIEKSGPMKK